MRKILTNTIILLIVTAIGIFSFSACNKKANEDKIIDVEKEFNIHLWEKLDGNGGNLQLIMSTIKNQPCGNTHIEMNTAVTDYKITITLKSLITPPACNNVPAPASDTLSFGNIKNGQYELNINLKDDILNNGTLTVNESAYKINLDKQDGISLITPELMRIPNGTVWGYVAYDGGQDAKLIKFFDNLNKIATSITMAPGNYGHFTISSTKVDIKESFDTKKQNTRQIFYKLNKSYLELVGLISEYRAQGLDIKLLTYDGKIL